VYRQHAVLEKAGKLALAEVGSALPGLADEELVGGIQINGESETASYSRATEVNHIVYCMGL
jgi:hypothetical protein